MGEDLPGFTVNEELEGLLSSPVSELEEDTRLELQRYKARKLKARRDAGESGAPERADVVPGEVGGSPEGGGEPTTPTASDAQASPEEDGEGAPPEDAEESVEEVDEATPQADAEAEEEEVLPREELGAEPGEERLLQARLIEQPVEQDDSEGIFFTTVDRRKVYLAYGANRHFLTLYYFQVPTTLEGDPELVGWIKDLLARRAFEHAEENDLRVIPQRADVSEAFLQRHPEFQERVKRPARFRGSPSPA